MLRGETVTFKGRYIHVVGAGIPVPPTQARIPLWFGGSSPAAHEVAAKHIDTYLSWGETPEQSEAKIRFGIRLYVIVRETEDAAWAAAQDLYDHMDKAAVAGTQV